MGKGFRGLLTKAGWAFSQVFCPHDLYGSGASTVQYSVCVCVSVPVFSVFVCVRALVHTVWA